jgi:hypothetical protein
MPAPVAFGGNKKRGVHAHFEFRHWVADDGYLQRILPSQQNTDDAKRPCCYVAAIIALIPREPLVGHHDYEHRERALAGTADRRAERPPSVASPYEPPDRLDPSALQ